MWSNREPWRVVGREGAQPGTGLGVAGEECPGGRGRGQAWNRGWEEVKDRVPPAPQARRLWGDPLTLHTPLMLAGPTAGPGPRPAEGVDPGWSFSWAGSGPRPGTPRFASPPQNLVHRVSGPEGLWGPCPGAPLTWNPVFPEGSSGRQPLSSLGGLQAHRWDVPSPGRSPRVRGKAASTGRATSSSLRSWGAPWWPMGQT